eukprot:1194488-Prorocentrum_minimum.AAC.14
MPGKVATVAYTVSLLEQRAASCPHGGWPSKISAPQVLNGYKPIIATTDAAHHRRVEQRQSGRRCYRFTPNILTFTGGGNERHELWLGEGGLGGGAAGT